MAILNFQQPDKIVLQKANDFEATFEFRPLEPGYGVTIGNALRRVLLNSLEGYAISGIVIEGVVHSEDRGYVNLSQGIIRSKEWVTKTPWVVIERMQIGHFHPSTEDRVRKDI